MVNKLLLIILLVFSFKISIAATKYSGLQLRELNLNKITGHADLSFAKIENLFADGSSISSIMAFRLSAKVSLKNLDLTVADFSGANLQTSRFENVNIGTAMFRDAVLTGTFFSGRIHNCNFDKADLRDANLSQASVSNCTFWGAKFNNKTQFPFDPFLDTNKGLIYVP